MKLKYQTHTISSPSHVERVLKLCYNKRKLAEATLETSPHGYGPCVLVQLGGDHLFYTSFSLGRVLVSFSILPYSL